MGKITEKTAEVEEAVVAESKHFEYGDLTVECFNCGTKQVLSKGVKDGLQLTILTNPDSYIMLVCSNEECKSKMKLFFEPGEKPAEEEEEENENIQEENKEGELS